MGQRFRPYLDLNLEPVDALEVRPETRVNMQELKEKWDRKLSERFPFAPSHLKPTMTQEWYDCEQKKFGQFVHGFWRHAFARFTTRTKEKAQKKYLAVEVGIGVGDTLVWVPEALKKGLVPRVYDVSHKALQHGYRAIHKLLEEGQLGEERLLGSAYDRISIVREGELQALLEHLNDYGLEFDLIKIFLLARTLQFTADIVYILHRLGWLLSKEADPDCSSTIVIVHPTLELNRNVKFKDTHPHSGHEIFKLLAEGAGREIYYSRIRTLRYFDEQVYSGLALAAADLR